MVIGMAPNVNAKVYVGPNGGSGPLDTYRAMVDGDSPAGGDLHQLGPVRGAAAAGLHPGRVVDLPAGRGPGPDRRGRRRVTKGPRTATCSRAPTTPARRSTTPASQPWVTSVGGTTIDALGPAADRVGVELGPLQRHRRGRELDASWTMPAWQRGPGVQSVVHQGARHLHRGPAVPDELGGGHACRAGRCPTSPPTPIPAPGSPSSARVSAGDGPGSAGRAWPPRCGGPWRRSPTRASRSPVGFVNPTLYQAQCAGSPVFNDVTVGEQPARGLGARATPRTSRRAPTTPPRRATTWPPGSGTPIASALVGRLRSPPPSSCPGRDGDLGLVGPGRGRHHGDGVGLEPGGRERGRLRQRQSRRRSGRSRSSSVTVELTGVPHAGLGDVPR